MARRVGLEQIGAEAVILGTPEFFKLSRLVESHLEDINKTTKKLEADSNRSWQSMATAVGVASAAVVASAAIISAAVGGLAGIAVGVATEFESKFTIVEAITRGTADELDQLKDVLRGIGTTSIVSMNQAAEAAGELARGGIAIQDQIGGAVKAVTDLTIASAGELEIGRSATLVAAALNAFSLEGKDATTVVNAITAAAQRSSITFVDLQRSFQQVAPVASAFSFTVEETAAALGVLGLAGIRGSDAGTSLKQAFIQLAKPTKVGAELMNEFGINLLDTEGKARPLRDVIIDLERAFGPAAVASGKLTEAQRRFAVAAIFGSDAIRAALVSATQGVGAFDAMTDAMHDATFSAEALANIMQQPLAAQFIILQNNISSLVQRIGEGLLPILRSVTVEAIRFAQNLDPIAKAIGSLLKAIGGAGSFEDAFKQIENVSSANVVNVLKAIIEAFDLIRDTITVAVIPAFRELFSAIGNFISQEENITAINSAIANTAQVISEVGLSIAAVASFFTDLINKASTSAEGMARVRAILFAITLIPIATVAAGIAAIALAALQVIGPIILIGLAIAGVIALVASLTGAFDSSVQTIEAIVESANVTPEPDVAALQTKLEQLDAQYRGVVDSINTLIEDTDVTPSPDIETLQTILGEIETEYQNTVNEIDRIISSTEIDIVPDPEDTGIGAEAVVDVIADMGETISAITEAAAEQSNKNLAKINATPVATTFDIVAAQIRIIISNINETLFLLPQTVDNVALELINGLLRIARAFVGLIGPAAELEISMTRLFSQVFVAVISNATETAIAILTAFSSILGSIIDNTGQIFAEFPVPIQKAIETSVTILKVIVDALAKLAAFVSEVAISWAKQWESMGGIVAIVSRGIIENIANVVSALSALGNVEIPQITLPNVGTALEELGLTVRQTGENIDGFRNNISSLKTEFNVNLANTVANFRRNIEQTGSAAQSSAPGLNDFADGAKKAKKAAEEAGPAIEGFNEALAKALRLQEFVNAFGDVGAKAIDSLVNAVVSNIDKDGARAAEALADFIKELRESLVPETQELAAELTGSFAVALIERSDEAIDAAKEVLSRAVDTMKAQGRLTLETFRNAFNFGDVSRQLGSDGAKLIESIVEALENGSTKLNKAIGAATSGIIAAFADKLPIETARAFGAELITAIERVIIERTPQATAALQDLIRSLNFQAEIIKLQRARDKAIEEAAKTASETIARISRETEKELAEIANERAIRQAVEIQISSLKELNDARLDALRQQQAWNRQVRELEREERDIRRNRAREDVETEQNRLDAIDEARKNAAERAREALKGKGTPVGGLTITRGSDSEDALRKELADIEKRFAKEKEKREQKRKEEDADRQQRLSDNAKEANQSIVDAIALTNLRNDLNREVIRIQNEEEQRQHNNRLAEIRARAAEQIAKAEEVKQDAIDKANDVFAEQEEKLNFLTRLANEMFDGALADVRLINSELDNIATRFGDIKISPNSTEPEEDFQHGGVIPGQKGQPKVVLAHGGEVVLSLAQVKALESRFVPPVQMGSSTSTTNFNVNANYGQPQDPGSILLDLQALAAMAGR